MMMRKSLNLHSSLRDSSELIKHSDASQNFTRMQCNFRCLQNHFIDDFSDPVLNGAFIYAGDVPFKYNEQEGMYTEIIGETQ